MVEEQMALAQELETQDWVRQFIVEAGRADEYVELYEEMGDKVRVEPVTPDLIEALRPAQDVAEECTTCLLAACDKYVVIYTCPSDI